MGFLDSFSVAIEVNFRRLQGIFEGSRCMTLCMMFDIALRAVVTNDVVHHEGCLTLCSRLFCVTL
jgi:hypothetical protein